MTPNAPVRSGAWLLGVGLAVAWVAWRIAGPVDPVTTDILALLPQDRMDPVVREAVGTAREGFGERLPVLVIHDEPRPAARGAEQAESIVREAPGAGFDDVGRDPEAFRGVFLPHRFQFLTVSDRRRLADDPAATFAGDVLRSAASPGGMLGGGNPSADPAGYLQHHLTSFPAPYPGFARDGALYRGTDGDRTVYLLPVRLEGSAFSNPVQERTGILLDRLRSGVTDACPDCEVLATGAVRFAAASRRQAQTEVFWLSSASVALIVILVVAAFRSARPLLFAVPAIGTGVVAGSAAVLAVFEQVHVLTFVFGTTLIGISIDYAFHYFAGLWSAEGETGSATARRIRPAVTLGLVTTSLAFGLLVFTGMDVLAQVMVYSITGLLAVYLTVLFVFPAVLRRAPPAGVARVARIGGLMAALGTRTSARLIIYGLAAGAAVFGLWQAEFVDDIRSFRPAAPEIEAEDRRVRETLGVETGSGFFLVRGATLDGALAREERLRENAAPPLLALSRFVPSQTTRQSNRGRFDALFGQWDGVTAALADAGLDPAFVEPYRNAWAKRGSIPEADVFLAGDSILADLNRMVIRATDGVATVARPLGSISPAAGTKVAERVDGVRYIDAVAMTSRMFEQVRERAQVLLAAAGLVIGLILLSRYGWRGGLRGIRAPLMAVGFSLGGLALTGQAINIFALVGLILVLGISIDYVFFIREGRYHLGSASPAVTLSAITTLGAFGLLSLSSIPALSGFGITVVAGIAGAFLAATTVLSREEYRES